MRLPLNAGPLAILQAALLVEFAATREIPAPVERDGVSVVTVRGPILHHVSLGCDSYDAIKARVAEALARGSTKAVLLSIDSPGGLVSGCFDTVTEIRALAEQAGKPLFAYVDGQTCSAAYALACAAERIYVPEAGVVGSVGILEGMEDRSRQNAMMGVVYTIVTSGARKADGNPNIPATDESLAAVQKTVDAMAERFFALVADRRGVTPDVLRSLEGGVFVGQMAIDAKLADELATEDQAIDRISAELNSPARAEVTSPAPAGKEQSNMDPKEQALKALKALAEGKDVDDKVKEQAKAALAAFEDHEEPDGDEKEKAAAAAKAKAEADDKEKKDAEAKACEEKAKAEAEEKKDAEAQARAAGGQTLAVLSRVEKLEAENAAFKAERAASDKAKAEAEETGRLLASRPDLSADTVAFLAKQPIQTIRDACQPAGKGGLALGPGRQIDVNPLAATARVGRPTIGAGQGGLTNGMPIISQPETDEEIMDRRMGLSRRDPRTAIRDDGMWRQFGAMTADEAQKLLALRAEEEKMALAAAMAAASK